MKKAIIIILSILVVAGIGVGIFFAVKNSGGKKSNGVEISESLGAGKVIVSVPKNEDGTPKYTFTKTKPSAVKGSGTFYLETDKVAISFSTQSWAYNTSKDYKTKYGDKQASYDGYIEFMDDTSISSRPKLAGLEKFEINGRKALRYYSRTGGSGDYVYHGYNYIVGVDDLYNGSHITMGVYYKGTDEELKAIKEAKEFDQETLDIINSLKVVENK